MKYYTILNGAHRTSEVILSALLVAMVMLLVLVLLITLPFEKGIQSLDHFPQRARLEPLQT